MRVLILKINKTHKSSKTAIVVTRDDVDDDDGGRDQRGVEANIISERDRRVKLNKIKKKKT